MLLPTLFFTWLSTTGTLQRATRTSTSTTYSSLTDYCGDVNMLWYYQKAKYLSETYNTGSNDNLFIKIQSKNRHSNSAEIMPHKTIIIRNIFANTAKNKTYRSEARSFSDHPDSCTVFDTRYL